MYTFVKPINIYFVVFAVKFTFSALDLCYEEVNSIIVVFIRHLRKSVSAAPRFYIVVNRFVTAPH